MALNFPLSPTVGQEATLEGVVFVWSGVVWSVKPLTIPPFATQAEAVAGILDDVLMSPLQAAEANADIRRSLSYPAQSVTGLSSVEFNAIPAWATKLVFTTEALDFVNTNGAADIQLGTAAGWLTAGYLSTAQLFTDAATGTDTTTTGFLLVEYQALSLQVCLTLHKMAGRGTWASTGAARRAANSAQLNAGVLLGAGAITRARLIDTTGPMSAGFISMRAES